MNEYGYIFEDDFPSTMREIYIIFQKSVRSNMNSELIHSRFRNLSEDIQRNRI